MAAAGSDGALLPGTKKSKPIDIVRFFKRNIVTIWALNPFTKRPHV